MRWYTTARSETGDAVLDTSQKRALLIVAILVAMILIPLIVTLVEPTPSVPTTSSHHADIAKRDQQDFNPVLVFISRFEGFIDAHEKLFIVLSTFAIAAFTGTLFLATKALVRASAQQQTDLRESLRIAAISADAARRGAITGEKTFATMKDTAMRELRAYISVTMEYDPKNSISDAKYEPFAQIIPVWTNSGETPTRDMKMFTEASWMNKELAASGPIFTHEEFDEVGTVFPRSSFRGEPISLQVSQLARKSANPLFIFGAAVYRDVFDGGPWRTEFCLEVIITEDFFLIDGLRLSFRTHGKFNRADEECTNWYVDNR